MEPSVASMNGNVIPNIVLFITVVVAVALLFVVLLYDDCCFVDADVEEEEEDSKANTSEAGRNTLQHQSYK